MNRSRLQEIEDRLAALSSDHPPVLISLGENCGPAVKLREIGLMELGANFFDNTVIRHPATASLIAREFSGLFNRDNLIIGTWETIDSVYDTSGKIFFHHEFHIAGREKMRLVNGVHVRTITSDDIDEFLPAVRDKFEYMAIKFLTIARHRIRKTYLVREVNGSPLTESQMGVLRKAIASIGGRNFDLLVIHSHGAAIESHMFIEENGARWGAAEDWRAVASQPALV
jgi:hypothetical protein